MHKRRLIVGITGATGIAYGIRLLQVLQETNIETHLVVSPAGERARAYETDLSANDLHSLADVWHPVSDIGASIASGSFLTTMGMIILPCTIRSLSEIATGVTSNLLTRAADVTLKERRRLVLAVRETPLHEGHLESMLKVTRMGGIIAPPVPALYGGIKTLEQVIDHFIGRILDLFDIETECATRWELHC